MTLTRNEVTQEILKAEYIAQSGQNAEVRYGGGDKIWTTAAQQHAANEGDYLIVLNIKPTELGGLNRETIINDAMKLIEDNEPIISDLKEMGIFF